jgi:hypothetical protein
MAKATAKKRCPQCGERTSVPIAYGLPPTEMFEQARRGEIVLGGCVIFDDSPSHACTSCRHQFGELDFGESRQK